MAIPPPPHVGVCHCADVVVRFSTAKESITPRACQCDFCRRHGAKTVTDNNGFAEIVANGTLVRYRFGLMSADFLLCAKCGVYIGAALEADGITRVSLNSVGLQLQPWMDDVADPIDYSGETLHERLDRRRVRWTPARVFERAGA